MEHSEEARRLDAKTEFAPVQRQALWAGLKPGMRVADVGCGSGKTTHFLHQLLQPGGEIVGIDGSEERIRHAKERYHAPGIEFVCRDFYGSLEDLGSFDFIWVRFVLEYHLSKARQIVARLVKLLKPGGILCLIDLDHNCLGHFGLSTRLETTLHEVMQTLTEAHDFDPYAGRKLYSYLYDEGLGELAVDVGHHHLIYGELNETDGYNWTQKVEVAARQSGHRFEAYQGGYREFLEEFRTFFADPRRFTYTPLICCAGRKAGFASELDTELGAVPDVACA